MLNRDESMSALHDTLIERVRKALEDATSSNQGQNQGSQVGARDIPLQLIVNGILRPVVLETIREREGQAESTNLKNTRTRSVFLVYIS